MDRSIHEISRLTGTTSRTLRHYDSIGLLPATRIASNGHRHYDDAALVRLQRILLLRDMGLGLPEIAEALTASADTVSALRSHVTELREEISRAERRIVAVTATIARLERGEDIMAEEMFDGFDHRQHEKEVTERWGAEAYRSSDSWWTGLGDDNRKEWMTRVESLNRAWIEAWENGVEATSPQCQELAARHIEWLRSVPGTPANDPDADLAGYVRGLAEMYVSDDRFAANYGGRAGAELVRDALLTRLEGVGQA